MQPQLQRPCRIEVSEAAWLVDYLGAEGTPIKRAFGRIVLLAAVRRIRQPGVKFDYILVLDGKQDDPISATLR